MDEQVEQQEEEHNCWACPKDQEEEDDRPPVPPGGETIYSTLPCGHKIHTHCVLHFWMRILYS